MREVHGGSVLQVEGLEKELREAIEALQHYRADPLAQFLEQAKGKINAYKEILGEECSE